MITKSRLSALALATFVCEFAVPLTTLAAGCSLTALDSVAGLGTQVNIVGCEIGGSTTLVMRGPTGTVYTQQVVLDATGNATTLIPSKYATIAGTYEVSASSSTTTFRVIADRTDDANSSLIASPGTLQAGTQTATVTATLRDRYDNPVIGRPMALVSSRLADDIEPKSTQTDENGRFLWSVRTSEAGQITLIPYDIVSGRQLKLRTDIFVSQGNNSLRGSLTGYESGGTAYAAEPDSGIVDRFALELPQSVTNVKANELFSVTIRALKDGAVVRGYIGTLLVESSDPDAELPKKGEDPKSPNLGRIDFRDVDQGERKVPLSFVLRREGPQTIRVYDKADPSREGTISLNVLRSGTSTPGTIQIIEPKDRSRIKGHTVLLQGRAPSLINLKVKGGARPIEAETDTEGVFRVSVDLAEQDSEATLFVISENGTYESDPLHIIVDNEPPKIETISFDPPEGKAGDTARISVLSEPNLGKATATLNGKSFTLTETGAGLYVGEITAPEEDIIHDVTVKAEDSVGNETIMLTKWTVKPKKIATVQGVTAEGQPMQVLLKWQALPSAPVAEYKIYIAKQSDPNNYLYSVSTQKPVTSAVIKDLPLGIPYEFSLTAITTDGMESDEKSAPVTAAPLGFALNARPGDSSLLLEWSKVENLPLSQYLLEFGTEPGAYTERRTINGEASSYMLRDLLNGVSYELRLTPIAVTGKIMSELAAVTHGTPNGSGFLPGTAEPVPPDMFQPLHPGAQEVPPSIVPPPSTPGSGIPTYLAIIGLFGALFLGFQWRRFRAQQKSVQEFLQHMQERYHS